MPDEEVVRLCDRIGSEKQQAQQFQQEPACQVFDSETRPSGSGLFAMREHRTLMVAALNIAKGKGAAAASDFGIQRTRQPPLPLAALLCI